MFFIGVFGIENKDKEIETLNNLSCTKCNKEVTARLIKNYDYFHFFFIPLLKWNESYYVVCDQCKSVFTIPKEKGKAIENGENVQITYWDLKEVIIDNSNNGYYGERPCSNCGKTVSSNYKYCPHCGAKI